MLEITSIVAALAAASLTTLAILVTMRRIKVGPAIGVGDDPTLLRRIRAHGNFCEYVPLGILLIALAEYGQAAAGLLWTIAGLLVVGRLLHATGTLRGSTPLRGIGMMATYGALLLGAGVLVV